MAGTYHTIKTIKNHKLVEIKVFIPENEKTLARAAVAAKPTPTQTADRLQALHQGNADLAYKFALRQAKAASDGGNLRAVVHYRRAANILLGRF